jgi:hypothetical protein
VDRSDFHPHILVATMLRGGKSGEYRQGREAREQTFDFDAIGQKLTLRSTDRMALQDCQRPFNLPDCCR